MLTRRQGLAAAVSLPILALPRLAIADEVRRIDIPARLRVMLESGENAPVLGNPEGDVTLVAFFDYNCPWCRKLVDHYPFLVEQDPDLRVVFREMPFLDEGSAYAARVALAAQRQGQYWETHHALMSMNWRANEATVTRVARQVGLDMDLIGQDMWQFEIDDHIDQTFYLAQRLPVSAVPTMIAGNMTRRSDPTRRDMQDFIATARRNRG